MRKNVNISIIEKNNSTKDYCFLKKKKFEKLSKKFMLNKLKIYYIKYSITSLTIYFDNFDIQLYLFNEVFITYQKNK